VAAPTYGDRRVQTNPLSAPLVNPGIASPDAFGAPIAAGARSGLQSAFRGQQMREQAELSAQQERDDFDVLDADNQLVDATNDLRAKALQERGKNAIGLTDRTRVEFDKIVAERAKALTSPQAKQMFMQRAAGRWNALDSSVVGHAETEITRYKEATLQGAIEREGLEAIESMDPARIADAERKRFVARQALSSMQGVDLDVEHAKDASTLYAAATERFISAKDWRGAAKFYEENKGKILPSVRDKLIEPALNEARIQGETELLTAEITMPRNGAIPTRTQAMSAASRIKDPEVKSRTMASIKALYVERDQAHESDQEASYNALHKVLRENGGDINSLDPATVSTLDAKWWKTLQADAASFVGEATPSKKTYENLAATDHIRKIIDQGKVTNAEAMRQGLVFGNYDSGAEFPLSEATVRGLAANNGLTAEQTESVTKYFKEGGQKGQLSFTKLEQAFEYMTQGRKYDDDRKKYPNLFEQVQDRLIPGQEVTTEAINKAMAPLLIEGEIVAGGFYNPNRTYGQAASQDAADQWMPFVEPDKEKAIAQYLKDSGVVSVSPNVVRKWVKYAPKEMGGLGMPTPLRDGKPMTMQEAVLAGTVQGNRRDIPVEPTLDESPWSGDYPGYLPGSQ
jgi:hypothetical protein